MDNGVSKGVSVIAIGVIVLVVVAGIVSLTTVVSAGVGEIAVIVDPFASTESQKIKLGPVGPYWAIGVKAPWQDVIHLNTATRTVLMAPPEAVSTKPERIEAPIIVLSKDGLNIEVDLNLRYNLLPSKAVELFSKYPKLDFDVQLVQIVREAVRNVVVQFSAVEVIEKRGALDDPIRKAVEDKVRNDPSFTGSINLVGLEVLRILPPKDFLDAINKKLQAEQQVQQARFERERSVIAADAERQTAILKARGLAEAKLIEANATRTAILTVIKALGCKDAKCEETASQLYLTLVMYKEIASTGKNIIFLVGTTGQGQFFLIPIEKP